MSARIVLGVLCLVFANSLWAITCYFTLAKDNCWTNYTVIVDVLDASTMKVLTTVIIPAGKSWGRQTFACQPKENLMYRAQFSPAIWESEKGNSYYALNYWSLPSTVNSGDSAWNVSACYSSDFSQMPLPPDAVSTCKCNFDQIPAIPPQKI